MEVRKYLTACSENLVWLSLGATENFPQWHPVTEQDTRIHLKIREKKKNCLPVVVPKDKKNKSWYDKTEVRPLNLEQYLAVFHRIPELMRLLEVLGMTFGSIKAFEQEIFASYKSQIVPLGTGRRKDRTWLWQGKRKGFFLDWQDGHICLMNAKLISLNV